MYYSYRPKLPGEDLGGIASMTHLIINSLTKNNNGWESSGSLHFIDIIENADAEHSWEAIGVQTEEDEVKWEKIRAGELPPVIMGREMSRHLHGRDNFTFSSSVDEVMREKIRHHLGIALKKMESTDC